MPICTTTRRRRPPPSRSPACTATTTSRRSRRRVPSSGLHFIDPDTALNPHSLTAARHAAGAVVLATDLVMRGECRTAFCAVRPPGHHAERDRAMGFCLFNNVAVGAAHALAAHGVERVAIVDFDVHHGNGTEDIFSARPAGADGVDVPASAVSVLRARQSGARTWSTSRWRPAAAATNSATRCATTGCPRSSAIGRKSSSSRPASTRIARTRSPGLKLVEADYAWVTRELVARGGDDTRRGGSCRRWRAATRCRRSAAASRSTCASCSRRSSIGARPGGQRTGGRGERCRGGRALAQGGTMERRKFLGSCVRGVGRRRVRRRWTTLGHAAPRLYARTRLVDVARARRSGARGRRRNQLRLPVSVRRHAVLPAQARHARWPPPATLRREDGATYAWQGGVGPLRATIVAFSAICAHKLAYPTREVSFIRYQRERSATSDAQVIHCCADHSVYDPAQGARVVAGPAPQPLAAILLEHDAATDELVALGTRRRRAVRRVLRASTSSSWPSSTAREGERVRGGRAPRSVRELAQYCRHDDPVLSRSADCRDRRRRSLRKSYGAVEAVQGISFAVRARHDDGAARAATARARRRRCRCCSAC